uniref:Integrase catalytic domain-containing protein n=1 Tax=Esox lucius TaxID=8010 RepID=A0AAY5L1S7_ESOLU
MALILNLPTTTTSQVVAKLKATFARFGIPEVIVSDNGPQLASAEMREFSEEHDFVHVTSSPHYPQSNGQAERAVQVAKSILKQEDPLLALMAYRATPTSSTGVSPSELLMGRKIRITLPTLQDKLKPNWPNEDVIRRADAAAKQRQPCYYNRRNGVRILPPLSPGDPVLTKLDGQKQWTMPAVVHSSSSTPRSYIVETAQGERYRRNCHLQSTHKPITPVSESPDRVAPEVRNTEDTHHTETQHTPTPTQGTVTITHSGRVSKSPDKLDW